MHEASASGCGPVRGRSRAPISSAIRWKRTRWRDCMATARRASGRQAPQPSDAAEASHRPVEVAAGVVQTAAGPSGEFVRRCLQRRPHAGHSNQGRPTPPAHAARSPKYRGACVHVGPHSGSDRLLPDGPREEPESGRCALVGRLRSELRGGRLWHAIGAWVQSFAPWIGAMTTIAASVAAYGLIDRGK